jgi:hypothetical protein
MNGQDIVNMLITLGLITVILENLDFSPFWPAQGY